MWSALRWARPSSSSRRSSGDTVRRRFLKARGSRQQYMQLHEGRVALGPVALSRLIHVGDPRSAPAAVTALLHVPPAE
jgi:hypothetical protein